MYGFAVEFIGPDTAKGREVISLPLVLAAELPGRSEDRAVVTAVDRRLAAVPGVTGVQPPAYNPAGDAAVILLYPATAPQAAATASLVHILRSTVIPRATAFCPAPNHGA